MWSSGQIEEIKSKWSNRSGQIEVVESKWSNHGADGAEAGLDGAGEGRVEGREERNLVRIWSKMVQTVKMVKNYQNDK